MGKEITYIPVDFAKICLPLRDPKTKEYNKFNGRYSLKIENESFGIPFGSIPIFFLNYCCKIWNDKTRESDKISLGNSGYEFCRKIEQNTSSSMARNFENQLKRLLYAKIIYTTNKNHKLCKDDFFCKELHINFEDKKESYFIPSRTAISFLTSVMPVCKKTFLTLKQKDQNLALNAYMWLNHKHFTTKEIFHIKFAELQKNLGSSYSSEKNFKTNFKPAWNLVKHFYQHNSKLLKNSLQIIPSSTHILSSKKVHKHNSPSLFG